MSNVGATMPVPAGRTGTIPGTRGRMGGVVGILSDLEAHRQEYLAYMAEMENVKEEAASLTKKLIEEGCDKCVYTQGEVTLQNIKGWSDISIAYQFYICKLPIHFQVMKIMEWTYGVAFDGFVPKECLLIETEANYDQFFDQYGEMKTFIAITKGEDGLFLDQATKQNECALSGMPPGNLEWYFMQPISYSFAKSRFIRLGLKIKVIHKPMLTENIELLFNK